jgi:TetR/AcrR family transcriptional regulator
MIDTAEKYGRKQLEILRSAAAAFRKDGYHGASVDTIARALNMTKSNLYYYFKDKEEILFVCHDYSLDLLLELLKEVEASALPPDQKLRKLIVSFVHMIIDELHGTTLFLDLHALSPERLKLIIAKRDKFDSGIRRVLKAGMDEGLFRKSDPKLVTFAILGAVNWIPRWFVPRSPADSEEIGQAFADYLLSGVLTEQGRENHMSVAMTQGLDGR